jgi:hypothetical protein
MTDIPKSCATCPSFLITDEQVVSRFRRNTGSPMCGRYGTVLGKRSFNEGQKKKLWEEKAEACPSYGHPMPAQPEYKHDVMLPDPTVRDPNNIDGNLQDACTSCAMCSNFITESAMVRETGWKAGGCAAKGKLILGGRHAMEARACPYRQAGPNRENTAGLIMLPEYDDSFGASTANPVVAYFQQKQTHIEPFDWPTDAPVTPEDEAEGIKSWRKVEDPDGSGKFVHFPIFRTDFFPPEEQSLIPKTGSDEHPELYVDHFGGLYTLGVAWLELDETPLFIGEPGVGKTELLRHVAWMMNLPFHRISIMSSSQIDEIAGTMQFNKETGTYFQLGRVPKAWTKAGVTCIDEPNVAKDEAVWHFLRPMFDNSKQLAMDMWDGRILDRNPHCYMGLCINPAWDTRNVGAMEVADADVRRLWHVYIPPPPELIEAEIIKSRVELDGWQLTSQQLSMVLAISKDLRDQCAKEALPISWGIAQNIKVARALHWFSPPVAYRRAAGDFLDPQQLQIVLDQVNNHWTEGLPY